MAKKCYFLDSDTLELINICIASLLGPEYLLIIHKKSMKPIQTNPGNKMYRTFKNLEIDIFIYLQLKNEHSKEGFEGNWGLKGGSLL